MKTEYRPVTDLEKRRSKALFLCTLPPCSMTKRFARDLFAQTERYGEISEKQAAYLTVCCYRYRRQIKTDLVPPEAPAGYMTPKQRQELERYKLAMSTQPPAKPEEKGEE